MGWIGDANHLMATLRTLNADINKDTGQFLIYQEMPCSFLGLGDEYVVSNKSEFSVNGQRMNLAAALNNTSYGCKINVI